MFWRQVHTHLVIKWNSITLSKRHFLAWPILINTAGVIKDGERTFIEGPCYTNRLLYSLK